VSDDKFEQLLARSARRQTPPPGACPDAGDLAAFLDGSLDLSERRQLERHVADCSRCALHLATVARLEEAAGEHADVAAPAWWRQWQWAVPLATIVVVVAVWIAVPRDIDQPGRREAPATPLDDAARESADGPEALPDARRVDPGQESQDDSAPVTVPDTPRGSVPVGQTASSEAKAKEQAQGAAEEDEHTAPAQQRFKSERELQRAEPPADARQEEARFSASPDRQPSSPAAEKAQPPPPAGATAAVPGAADAARRADNAIPLQQAATLVVASPVPAVRWRVQDGRIERTVDAGRTWRQDHDRTVAGLRAGAAPSADVCWLAGGGGLVVRREPSGDWRRVPLPVASDIHAITSSAALEAVVTLADGRQLQTVDGGRTWVVP
jgi:hypothetical protein